jgi:hypothetical protein
MHGERREIRHERIHNSLRKIRTETNYNRSGHRLHEDHNEKRESEAKTDDNPTNDIYNYENILTILLKTQCTYYTPRIYATRMNIIQTKWTIYRPKKKSHKTLKFQETNTFLLRRAVVIVGD